VANADFEAAALRAETLLIKAGAERKSAEMKGVVLNANEELFKLELARVHASIFKDASLILTDEALAPILLAGALIRNLGSQDGQ